MTRFSTDIKNFGPGSLSSQNGKTIGARNELGPAAVHHESKAQLRPRTFPSTQETRFPVETFIHRLFRLP
jgi:hypothetical protein